MLWVLLALPVLAAVACAVLAHLICFRQSLPDFRDTEALKSRGWGVRADEIAVFRDWLAKKTAVEVRVDSDDELPLRGLLVTRKDAVGTVILFHGCRSGYLADFPGIGQFLYEKGYNLLLTDARAHGSSGGRWCTYGLWERFDVRAWCNYCAIRFPDGHPVFVLGQGMGAAAALAAAELDLPGNVRGIVAEGAYTSPREILEQAIARTPLPAGAVLRMANFYTRVFLGFDLRRDPGAEDAVRGATYPALILHGGGDSVVPPEMARRLFTAYGYDKQLLIVENAPHVCCRFAAPERWDDAVGFFLDAYLKHE